MAGTRLKFRASKTPETSTMKPGSYISVEPSGSTSGSASESDDANNTQSTDDSSSEDDISGGTASSNSDSDSDSDSNSDSDSDSPVATPAVEFYNLNDPKDFGSRAKIQKSWDKDARGPLGLVNHGVVCYMNSAIQVFFHIPAMVRYLKDVAEDKYSSVIKPNSVTMVLAKLLKRVNASKKKPVHPQAIIDRLEDINISFDDEYVQQDSHEFYISLMGRLQEDSVPIGKKMNESIICDIFSGNLNQSVVCKSCQAVSTTEQEFSDLNVNVAKDHKIESSIKNFFSVELIKPKGSDGYKCEKCGKVSRAYKVSTIKDAPEYLTVTVKRFKFDESTSRATKVRDPVKFPLDLDLTSYSTEKEPLKYRLVGAIVHEGLAVNSGHYIAFCRQPNGSWAEYDDEVVTPVPEKDVLKQKGVYVLVYTRLTQKHALAKRSRAKPTEPPAAKRTKIVKGTPAPSREVAKKKASQEIDDLFKKPRKV